MGLSDLLAGGGYPVTPTDPEYGNLVERDAPADLDFKRLLAGRGKQFQRDEFVSRPVDVSNTETSVAQVSPGTPQPDPGALRGDDGVFKPTNPQRGALIDSATKRLTELVNSPNPIFYKAQAAKAQEIATLTALLRGAEAQSWQEQAGADIPDERRARVETARARAAEARARLAALNRPPEDKYDIHGDRLVRTPAGGGRPEIEELPKQVTPKEPHKIYRERSAADPIAAKRGLVDVYEGYVDEAGRPAERLVMAGVRAGMDIPTQVAAAYGTTAARNAAPDPKAEAKDAAAKQERRRTAIQNLRVRVAGETDRKAKRALQDELTRAEAEFNRLYPGAAQ